MKSYMKRDVERNDFMKFLIAFLLFCWSLKRNSKSFERHSKNISLVCLPCSHSSRNVLFGNHHLWQHMKLKQIDFNCFFLNLNENSCRTTFTNRLIRKLCIKCSVIYFMRVLGWVLLSFRVKLFVINIFWKLWNS